MTEVIAERTRLNEVQINGKRHYELSNGDVVPSVTTFLDVLPKPALDKWRVKVTAEYAIDKVDDWAKLDATSQLIVPRMPRDATVDMMKGAPYSDTSARDNGNIVHKIFEDLFVGREPLVPKGFERAVDLFEQFNKDFEIEVLYIEPQLVNEKLKYSGSTDGIFRINGKLTVIDWKAGRGLYGSTAYQATAYARCEYIVTETGEEVEMPQVDQLMGVWLRSSGYAPYPLEYSQDTWDVVRMARRLYDLTAREWDYRGKPMIANALKSPGPEWGLTS